jgi:hypothetical protein
VHLQHKGLILGHDTFHRFEAQDPSCFDVSKYPLAYCFHDVGQVKRYLRQGLNSKVSMVTHAMHTRNKGGVIILQLHSHSNAYSLEDRHSISSKRYKLCSYVGADQATVLL